MPGRSNQEKAPMNFTHNHKAISRRLAVLSSITLLAVCAPVSAIPKAAEHENAPVTFGADAPKPKKLATTTKPEKAKKASPTAAKSKGSTSTKRRK